MSVAKCKKAKWKKITSKDLLICLILTPPGPLICWESCSSKNIVSYKYNCQNKFTDKVKSPFFVFNLMSKGPGTDISTFSRPRVNWQFTTSESMYPCIPWIPPFTITIGKCKPAKAAPCSTSTIINRLLVEPNQASLNDSEFVEEFGGKYFYKVDFRKIRFKQRQAI